MGISSTSFIDSKTYELISSASDNSGISMISSTRVFAFSLSAFFYDFSLSEVFIESTLFKADFFVIRPNSFYYLSIN